MRYFSESLPLPDTVFGILRDLVHDRIGLYFDEAKRDIFSDKLSPLVIQRGFGSFVDYYYFLKYEGASHDEWCRIADALSVQESFFWREIDQVRALTDWILPDFVKNNPDRPLIIWSAACAGGEEPLTIAMMLNEAGWFDKAKIDICASDASPRAVSIARAGLYRERAFRNLPIELRERYFIPERNMYRIRPEIQNRVRWQVVNLMDELKVRDYSHAGVIFCRNVFIYFSDATIRKTISLFADRMSSPGCLCVGAAESLLRLTDRFELQEIGSAFVYVRAGKADR